MASSTEKFPAMRVPVDDSSDLERALLHRGMVRRASDGERCGRCRRTPLMGERIYVYENGSVRCELCRMLERRPPVGSRMIHGPELGHTIRIADRRPT